MAVISMLLVLLVFFYLLLHKGLGISGSSLVIPAVILCGSVMALSVALYVARQRDNPSVLFAALGGYCAVFMCEAVYFASRLGYVSHEHAKRLYPILLSILTADIIISYYVYQYIRRRKES